MNDSLRSKLQLIQFCSIYIERLQSNFYEFIRNFFLSQKSFIFNTKIIIQNYQNYF